MCLHKGASGMISSLQNPPSTDATPAVCTTSEATNTIDSSLHGPECARGSFWWWSTEVPPPFATKTCSLNMGKGKDSFLNLYWGIFLTSAMSSVFDLVTLHSTLVFINSSRTLLCPPFTSTLLLHLYFCSALPSLVMLHNTFIPLGFF